MFLPGVGALSYCVSMCFDPLKIGRQAGCIGVLCVLCQVVWGELPSSFPSSGWFFVCGCGVWCGSGAGSQTESVGQRLYQ